jgi:hypothetical protein
MTPDLGFTPENGGEVSGNFSFHKTGWRNRLRGTQLLAIRYAADAEVDITQLHADAVQTVRNL